MKKYALHLGCGAFVGVETTGLKGGDSGYGARHSLEFHLESACLSVETEKYPSPARKMESVDRLRLTFMGDWELQALYGMLRIGLEELESQIVELPGQGGLCRLKEDVRGSIEEYKDLMPEDDEM